jgi:hypothetical protein
MQRSSWSVRLGRWWLGAIVGMLLAWVGAGVGAGVGVAESSHAGEAAGKPQRPRLVVLVVFDQLRGDFVQKWRPLFGPDGFARIQREGADFLNCHYPYATTTTGSGHASILTGASPAQHAIVNNEWYDRASGEMVYCAGDARYTQVPPRLVKESETEPPMEAAAKKKQAYGGAPTRQTAQTIGDVLREVFGQLAVILGLSIKDRGAILPVGQRPTGAYWFDSRSGQFVTSTYYRDKLPKWLAEFNASRPADRWLGKQWERLRPDLDYVKHSGPDDVVGEAKGVEQGRVFPHPFAGKGKPNRDYYDSVVCSPAGNDLLLAAVAAAIDGEKLGQDDIPDLLNVSFSSNDIVGHAWGPDSQEVLDITLRSDLIVRDLLRLLDEKVGKGRYVLAITADHGICPLPEVASTQGKDARRYAIAPIIAGAEDFLRQHYRIPPEAKLRWLEEKSLGALPWLYLNEATLTQQGLSKAEVSAVLADWLRKQPGIHAVFTRAQLTEPAPAKDKLARQAQLSFHPHNAGDLLLVGRPYCLFSSSLSGTTHGSPHDYDTHVPLLVMGPGVRAGRFDEPVTPQAIAAIFAESLGVPRPDRAQYPVPESLRR